MAGRTGEGVDAVRLRKQSVGKLKALCIVRLTGQCDCPQEATSGGFFKAAEVLRRMYAITYGNIPKPLYIYVTVDTPRAFPVEFP